MLSRFMFVRFFCLQKHVALKLFLSLYLLQCVTSCGIDSGEETLPNLVRNNQVFRRPLDVSGSYVINPVTGDSIKPVLDRNGASFETMNPTTAKGRIDEFYQQPTKVVPATWEKLDKKLSSKIQRIEVDIIQKPLVYDTLPVVEDSAYVLKSAIGDTILTGIPLKIEGKKISVKYPEPVSGFPPALHYDNAVNLKRLGVDQGLSIETTTGIVEDSYGNKWMSYLGMGLSKYDGQSFWHFTEKEGLPSNYLWGILATQDGKLWLNTINEGVIVFDGQSFTNYSAKEGFPGNGIRDIFEDSKGNIWLMRKYGVSKYDGEHFTHFTTKEGLVDNTIIRIYEDKAGFIWMVGLGKVSRYDGTAFTSFSIKHPEGVGYINPLFEDHAGNLWLSSENELFRYDGTSFTRFPANLREFRLYWHEDSATGHIWIAYYNDHIYKYDGKEFIQYGAQDGLPPMGFSYSIEDRQHNLWFGSAGGGLVQFDGVSFTVFSEKEGLSSNDIISIAEDQEGNIWLGTNGKGLMKYDGTSFTYYTEKNGLSHNVVTSIAVDPENQIWVGTGDGLNVLIPKSDRQIPDMSEDPTEAWIENDYIIYSFSKKDGLVENMIGWNSLSIDEENVLWGTLFGKAFKLNINHFVLPQAPISVHLDHLDINGRSVDFRNPKENLPAGLSYTAVLPFFNYPSNPTFSYANNHLTFHYSATDWSAPHKVQYSYRMADSDEDWSVPSSETKADFRNLSPGLHTFEVRAIGQSQKWGESFTYAFRILPPWWKTWWAYTGYLLLIAGLGYVLYRYQLRRQLQKQEVENLKALDAFKTNLYTNITHEFRTPLTIISGMIDQINEKPDLWLERGTKMIKQNTAGLLNLVNQLLDLRKLESNELKVEMVNGDVVKYLRYISESHQSYAEQKGLQLHFFAADAEIKMDYDPDKLLRIISNLLSNAIKFTPEGGNIYFHIEKKILDGKPTLSLRVEDTGVGIPEKSLPHIFGRFYQADHSSVRKEEGTGIGLALVQELVKILGGHISVESTVGKGSIFTIELPVSNVSLILAEGANVRLEERNKVEDAILEPALANPDLMDRTTGSGAAGKPSLLIVEDNPDVQQYLIACLEDAYQLLLAENGRIGIETAIEQVPDLIVSDVMMPEKDGYELTEILKNDERTDHIPIVLLTAKADFDSRISGLEKGADAYLAKPFEKRELLVRLEKLLELRKKLQARYARVSDPTGEGEVLSIPEHPFLQKFYALVEAEIANPQLDMNQLCRALGMSRSQVYKKLKALTGKSATALIRSFRLHRGKQLLATTDLTISEVAYEVGFTSLNYFSATFFEEFGVRPSNARN